MPRIVRVSDAVTHPWYISVCDKCGAEVGMSASLYSRNDAETARCFVCEPGVERLIVCGVDSEDDFATDQDLRSIDDSYERERTLAEVAWWKAYGKGDRA